MAVPTISGQGTGVLTMASTGEKELDVTDGFSRRYFARIAVGALSAVGLGAAALNGVTASRGGDGGNGGGSGGSGGSGGREATRTGTVECLSSDSGRKIGVGRAASPPRLGPIGLNNGSGLSAVTLLSERRHRRCPLLTYTQQPRRSSRTTDPAMGLGLGTEQLGPPSCREQKRWWRSMRCGGSRASPLLG